MRLRTAGVFLLGICLGLSTVVFAAKETKPAKRIPQLMRENGFKHKTASWTTVSTQTGEDGKSTTSEGKMWISGDKYRMESQDKQNKKTMVFLDDGKDVYMYTPEDKKAIKWGASAEKMFGQILNSDMVAESARQRKTAKKLGTEVVDGKPCDIYAYKSTVTFMDNAVTSDVKEWVWAKESFPIKSQIKTPKHKMKIVFMTTDVPASETVSEVKNLELDKSMDDALFTLPAGTKVDVMEMPENAGGAENGQTSPGASSGDEKPSEGKSKKGSGGEAQQDEPPAAVKNMLKGLF